MAGRFVDFYALLEVASDASVDVVRAALAEQRKIWTPQEEDGDGEARRTADDRLRDLDLAELVLLDEQQRTDYDEEWRDQWASQSPPGGATASNGTSAHPVAIAAQPAERPAPAADERAGDQRRTAPKQPAAPEAKTSGDKAGDSVAQARQAMHDGEPARAIDAYHYAIMLQPQDVMLHYELGQAYVAAGNHEQALGAFESASRYAPHVANYRAAVGNTLVHLARPGDAIGVLEQVVAEAPTEPGYRAALAQALHDTCVHEMTLLTDGMVCITTAEQAQLVERLTGRALTLLDPGDNSELAQDIREKHELAKSATARVWRPPLPLWLMIGFVVVLVGGFALVVKWWLGLIVLAVLGAVGFLLGLQPTYWHVAREARAAGLLVETEASTPQEAEPEPTASTGAPPHPPG